MSGTYRATLLILWVGLLALVVFLPNGHADPMPMGEPKTPDTPPANPDPDKNADVLNLPTDRQAKKKVEAAADYIKIQSWADAVRLLQSLLDAPEDVFIPVRAKDKDGKPDTHWVSARSEATRLLGSLPPAGLEFYQLQYGATARLRLDEARAKRDLQLLDDVARRYFYTQAGADAVIQLASYHLDRGRPATAAFYFDRLLQRPGNDKLEPLTLFKAAVAFQQSSDRANAELAWKRLGLRLGNNGLRLGDRTLALEPLRREIDKLPTSGTGGRDWAVFRGDARRSVQGQGGAPYLEPRWQIGTLEHPDVRRWIDLAVRCQEESLQPALPAFFPIVAGGKVVFRGHDGIHAVDLKTGQPAWRSWRAKPGGDEEDDLPLSLERCMKVPGKKVQVENWLRMYSPFASGPRDALAFGGIGGLGGMLGVQGGGPPIGFANLGGQLGLAGGNGGTLGTPAYAPSLLFENSTLGTLSSDGRRVYAIEDLFVPPHPSLIQQIQEGATRPLGPLHQAVYHNELRAFDLDNGKKIWAVGSSTQPPPGLHAPAKGPTAARDDRPEDLADGFFLGAPLPLHGKLYLLQEKHGDIRLLCLDPERGEVVWTQPLVTVHDKMLTDVGRRFQAVHLAYAEGVLVCPTNAGAVLGVDLLSHSLIWAYSYRERTPPSPEAGGGEPIFTPVPLIPQWKSTGPVLHDGKVVFTSADNEAIHCINLHDGALVWKAGRTEDDLYVGGVFDDKVLVVGKSTTRALSLKDGASELWKVATGMPSGAGVASGNVYYLPLRRGAIAALDLAGGQIAGIAESRNGTAPGNLLFHEGEMLSQSVGMVAAYPQLKVRLDLISERLARNPRDPVDLTERGELRLYQGDLVSAIADLRLALNNRPAEELLPRTQGRLYEAMTQLLQRDYRAGEQYLEEYRALCKVPIPRKATPEQRAQLRAEERTRQTRLLCLVARGREQQPGRLSDALEDYRELVRRADDGQLASVVDDPLVKARLDVWARGRVAALFNQAGAEQRPVLEEIARGEWQRLQAADDVEAIGRFVTLFGPVCPAGREARLRLAELLMDDPDHPHFLEAELHLLQLRQQTDDPPMAARALEALGRLYTHKGFLDEAAACYRELASAYPAVVVSDGKPGAAFLEELAGDKRFFAALHEPPPAWAPGKIKTSDATLALKTVPQLAILEPPGELPPALRRQMLALDLATWQLKLLDREMGTERAAIRLPLDDRTRQALAQNLGAGTRLPCYVQGHLVVLSLGTQVCGVDLFDRRILWKRPLADGSFDPTRMTLGSDETYGLQLYLVDRSGQGGQRLLARTGPAGLGYVVLQTPAGLTVLDPARGEPLWVRTDVIAETDVFGDDQQLYLAGGTTGGAATATRALRAYDGVAERVPDFAAALGGKLQALGPHLLVKGGEGDSLVLRLYDIRSGQDVWKLEGPANTLVLDSHVPHLAGKVDPDGKVTVVDLRSRREVLRAALDPAHLKDVQEVHLLADGQRIYLACRRPTDPKSRLSGDPWGAAQGMNSVWVNGWVYAFDRASGEAVWWNQVPNQMLLLEQFEELPIVLFVAGLNREASPGNVTQSMSVHSIDKVTGKRLLIKEFSGVNVPFHALQVDPRAHTIDLVSSALRVRHYQATK
jgi:outer membrane protein assembly factor BamB/tetratricopeptide (TPR) repeat protein